MTVRARRPIRKRRNEAGIALLIAIFILLLISVVAITLIISSGTESALAGNYRSATGVYYAGIAGLEEVRGRLRTNNPNSFNNTAPGFLPPPGTPVGVCAPVYVLNSAGGENITPWDPANAYYDNEFGQELGGICAGGVPNPSPTTPSVWNRNPLNGLPFSGPLYKWVRINGITEQALNLDTSPYDGIGPNLVYYDGTNLNDTNTGNQVLEVTALAVLPNGSRRILQYLTAPGRAMLPPFLAALTLLDGPGNSITFHAPAFNGSFTIKGDDQDCADALTGTKYPAVGVFNNPDQNDVINGIPAAMRPSYTGLLNPGPDVEKIDGTFPANLQTPLQLEALAQSIIQNADVVITPTPSANPPYLGTATGNDLQPLGMSPSKVQTVVVQGNLDLNGWGGAGYGLLLVTGTFTYDPATQWDGIVLVIGQGNVAGSDPTWANAIYGAALVAKTRDANGSLLPSLGGASVVFQDGMNGFGIRYSSCWIQKSQPKIGYKILSFHEIPQ